jgi:hypothetical protein
VPTTSAKATIKLRIPMPETPPLTAWLIKRVSREGKRLTK